MEFGEQIVIAVGFLGLMALVAMQLKRRGKLHLGFRSSSERTRRLESIERLALTPSTSLHLVRVGERTLLIGVSASGCSLLDSTGSSTHSQPRSPALSASRRQTKWDRLAACAAPFKPRSEPGHAGPTQGRLKVGAQDKIPHSGRGGLRGIPTQPVMRKPDWEDEPA